VDQQQDLSIAGMSIELRQSLSSLRTNRAELISFSGLPQMSYGFFPGGNGLYDGIDSKFRDPGGTLILGSNFGCESEFIDEDGKLVIEDERANKTWSPLLERLSGAGVPIGECFFTNAWPFLHRGEGNLPKGLIPIWLRDENLMTSCKLFFRLTFSRIKPNLIIALGTGPAAFLSQIWPASLSKWGEYSISCLDNLPRATVTDGSHSAVCVAITHPSMPNAWQRRPPYQHAEGEILLLKEARIEAKKMKMSPMSRLEEPQASCLNSSDTAIERLPGRALPVVRTRGGREGGLHVRFEQALKPHVGRELSKREMKEILQRTFPQFPDGSVVPTDHAEPSPNHVNQCRICANPAFQILDTVVDGLGKPGVARYRVRDFKPLRTT